jgi:hypothetical protein
VPLYHYLSEHFFSNGKNLVIRQMDFFFSCDLFFYGNCPSVNDRLHFFLLCFQRCLVTLSMQSPISTLKIYSIIFCFFYFIYIFNLYQANFIFLLIYGFCVNSTRFDTLILRMINTSTMHNAIATSLICV